LTIKERLNFLLLPVLTFVVLLGCTAALSSEFLEGLGLYENGQLKEAREAWTAAAINEDSNAQLRLGLMLANGEGGRRNLLAAYAWLALAHHNGAAEAGELSTTLLNNHIPRHCQYEAMKLVREFKMGIFERLTTEKLKDSRCWKFDKPNKS